MFHILCIVIFPLIFCNKIDQSIQMCSKSYGFEVVESSNHIIFKNFNSFKNINFFCFNLSVIDYKNVLEFLPSQKVILDQSISFEDFDLLLKPKQNQMIFNFLNIKEFYSSSPLFGNLVEKIKHLEIIFYHSKFLWKRCNYSRSYNRGLFDKIYGLEFSYTVKYYQNTCSMIFKNTSIEVLKFHGLSKSLIRFNQISFDTALNIKQLNASVTMLGFFFYNGNLYKNMIFFKKVNEIYIFGSLNYIEENFFEFINVKKITLYIDNHVYFLSKGIEWMKSINSNLKINFSNLSQVAHNLDKITILEFRTSASHFEIKLDWLDDSNFCVFEDFPDDKLVIPMISVNRNSNCTCLMIWLFKRTRILMKLVKNSQLKIINSCSNESLVNIMMEKCNFNRLKILCSIIKNQIPQKNTDNIIFYKFQSLDLFLIFPTYFLLFFGIITNLMNTYILSKIISSKKAYSGGEKNLEKMLEKMMLYNSVINIFYFLTRLVHLIGKCNTYNGYYCSFLNRTYAFQIIEIYFVHFFGSLLKLFSNLTLMMVSILRLINLDPKLYDFIKKKRNFRLFYLIIIISIIIYIIIVFFSETVTKKINENITHLDDLISYNEYPDANFLFSKSQAPIGGVPATWIIKSINAITFNMIISILDFVVQDFLFMILFAIIEIVVCLKAKYLIKKKKKFNKNSDNLKKKDTIQKNLKLLIIFLVLLILFKLIDVIIRIFILYQKTTHNLNHPNICYTFNKVCSIIQEISEFFFSIPLSTIFFFYLCLNKKFYNYLNKIN